MTHAPLRSSLLRVLAGAVVAIALAACGQEGGTPQSPPAAEPGAPAQEAAPAAAAPSASARAEAEEIFKTRCATCHGASGAGDGPASAGLTPPPRNFQDPAWQASVTDAHIEQIIQYGGAAVGKSAAMPANPDLTSRPEVVAALRAYVRGLAR